jgi:hypothetical protein
MSFLISVFILDDLSPNIAKYFDKVYFLKFVWIAKSTKGNYKKRNFLKFGKQLLTFWSILQTIVAGFASLLVLALLRSADLCVSVMEMSALISLTLDLLVLETTNRDSGVLAAKAQARTVVVIKQGNVVRGDAIVRRGTPVGCIFAHAAKTPITIPNAGRQRRKRIGVGSVAVIIPTRSRLELGPCRRRASHDRNQFIKKFSNTGQVPALGADAPHQGR